MDPQYIKWKGALREEPSWSLTIDFSNWLGSKCALQLAFAKKQLND